MGHPLFSCSVTFALTLANSFLPSCVLAPEVPVLDGYWIMATITVRTGHYNPWEAWAWSTTRSLLMAGICVLKTECCGIDFNSYALRQSDGGGKPTHAQMPELCRVIAIGRWSGAACTWVSRGLDYQSVVKADDGFWKNISHMRPPPLSTCPKTTILIHL